ncbi:MAG: penicillin acylase family protein [Caulobacteraceae bacterium]
MPNGPNREVLGASERITVDECLALQTDVFCGNALRRGRPAARLKSDDAMVDSALRLLEAWDGHEPLDSAAAAIAEVWLNKHLGPHLAARITTPDAAKLIAFGQPYALSTYLQDPAADLGEPHGDPAAARESLLLASLKSALDEIAERLGPNMPACGGAICITPASCRRRPCSRTTTCARG